MRALSSWQHCGTAGGCQRAVEERIQGGGLRGRIGVQYVSRRVSMMPRRDDTQVEPRHLMPMRVAVRLLGLLRLRERF